MLRQLLISCITVFSGSFNLSGVHVPHVEGRCVTAASVLPPGRRGDPVALSRSTSSAVTRCPSCGRWGCYPLVALGGGAVRGPWGAITPRTQSPSEGLFAENAVYNSHIKINNSVALFFRRPFVFYFISRFFHVGDNEGQILPLPLPNERWLLPARWAAKLSLRIVLRNQSSYWQL